MSFGDQGNRGAAIAREVSAGRPGSKWRLPSATPYEHRFYVTRLSSHSPVSDFDSAFALVPSHTGILVEKVRIIAAGLVAHIPDQGMFWESLRDAALTSGPSAQAPRIPTIAGPKQSTAVTSFEGYEFFAEIDEVLDQTITWTALDEAAGWPLFSRHASTHPDIGPATIVADTTDLHAEYSSHEWGDIDAFVGERPVLGPVLAELPARVAAAFGPDTPIWLEIYVDPDEGGRQLVASIHTQLDPPQALARLQRFDESWWLALMPTTGGALCVTVDYA